MNDLQTTDPIIRINDLRAKVAAGEQLTKEELGETIALLRASRVGTKPVSAKPSNLPADLKDLFK